MANPLPPASQQPPRATLWMPSKHMGNLLVSLKSIKALEAHFGTRQTTLVVDNSYRDIIEAAGFSCAAVYFPRTASEQWHHWRSIRQLFRFIRQLWRYRGPLGVAIEGDKVTRQFITLSGADRRLGPDNRHCQGFDQRIPLDHREDHRFFDYATVSDTITGQTLAPGYPPLRPNATAQANLERVLGDLNLDPARPLVILHPGATKNYKQWPVGYFAQLAQWLAGRGNQVLVTGAGARDGDTIRQLTELAGQHMVSLHNRLSIAELIAACRRAALFIGNDTGPTHLAAATGTPTIAIFGPTDEKRWGPMGANVQILRSKIPCAPGCSRRACLADYRCMRTLDCDTVKGAVAQMDLSPQSATAPSYVYKVAADQVVAAQSVEQRQPTIVHLFKRYNGNYPLLNSMVATTPGKYRTLVCYLSGVDDGNNGVEALGVKTVYLNLDRSALNWRNPGTLRAVRELIDAEGCDLLVCQFRRTIPIGVIAARLSTTRPAVLGILHGIVRGKNGPGEKLLNAIINPMMSGWISVSRDGMNDIYQQNIAIPRDKIFYVQNGLDYSRFVQQPRPFDRDEVFGVPTAGKRTFLIVGRLYLKKNHQRIIEAFKRTLAQAPDSLLMIAGSGPMEAALKNHVRQLGLEQQVHFLGHCQRVADLLQAADVFLMPSLREGLPLALLEAMASGLPVITSNINGMREVVDGVDCGWLVDPNSTNSIAAAILAAARLPKEQLVTMGQQGKAHVIANFSEEHMVHNYENLFDTTLAKAALG